MRLVDEPPRVDISPDKKSACAGWVAHDPENGTNSAADIAVVAHVKQVTSPAAGLQAAAVLLVVIGSGLLGCAVDVLLGRWPRRQRRN